jgi:hypothetical protein
MMIASARTCQLLLSAMLKIFQKWALESMANVPKPIKTIHGVMSRRLAEDLPVLVGIWLMELQ